MSIDTEKTEHLNLVTKIRMMPRSSYINKGNRKKDNENIEIPRRLALDLAEKAYRYYLAVEQIPYDPTCNCNEILELLLQAVGELPDGETVDRLEQIVFSHCPACGQPFKEDGV